MTDKELKQLKLKRKLEIEWLRTFTYQELKRWLEERSDNSNIIINYHGKRLNDKQEAIKYE